jgi:hypothetical protein
MTNIEHAYNNLHAYIKNYIGTAFFEHIQDGQIRSALVLICDVSFDHSIRFKGISIRVDVLITSLTSEGSILQDTADLYFCNVTEFDDLFLNQRSCYIPVQ